MGAGTTTVELAMTGPRTTTDEVTWTPPSTVTNVVVCAKGGDIKVSDATGMGSPFTFPAGVPVEMTAYLVLSETFYFTGGEGTSLSIIYRHT